MEKCEYWHVVSTPRWNVWRQTVQPSYRYQCWGTKECEECSCGGDQTKCDFYPEKRKKTCEFYIEGVSPVGEIFHWCRQKEPWVKCLSEGDKSECKIDCTDIFMCKIADVDRPNKNGVVIPMKTAEMWLAAQQDGKTYYTGDMAYSAKHGLHDYGDTSDVWPMEAFHSFSELMEYDWVELKTMKRSEAEARLGVKILD